MKVSNDKRDNVISQEDFNAFLQDKEMHSEDNKERLFESFILFKQFMSYMIEKQVTERKEINNNHQEQRLKLEELNEKNLIQIENDDDIKHTEGKEKMMKNYDETNCNMIKHIDFSLKYSESFPHKEYINYDDIPIKPITINFVELVEKNLAELLYQPEINNVKKIKRNLINPKATPINKRNNQSSQSQNSNPRKKSDSPNKDKKAKSLPKKTKEMNTKLKKEKKISRKKKKEEMRDELEEKPKDLPNFIKENDEYDSNQLNDDNEHSISLVADEEIHQNENQSLLCPSDSIKIMLPHYEDSMGKLGKNNSKSPLEKSNLNKSESEDIINNCDSSEEEKSKKNKELRVMAQKEKNKELIDEINKIKGNINILISNPIYHKPKDTKNKNKNQRKKSENTNTNNNPTHTQELNKQIDYEDEIAKLKEEQLKANQIKKEYREMKEVLQRDIEAFNYKKKKEYLEIERVKNEELSKVSKLKSSKSSNNQTLLSKQHIEYQQQQSLNSKDKEEIGQLKAQLIKLKEEAKIKENSYKLTIDKFNKQLQEANSEIAQLRKENKNTNQSHYTSNNNTYRNAISYTNPNMKKKEKSDSKVKSESSNNNKKNILTKRITNNTNQNNNIAVIKDNNLGETFKLCFPSKYNIGISDVVIKREQLGEGTKLTYSNNMKEIIFHSGVKKKVFEDGYQIIFFNNNDIKQIFPNGKNVYYFSESKITQTTLPNNNCHFYSFPNGQIEKHFPNGSKEIINKPTGLIHYNNIILSQSNRQKKKEEALSTNKPNANKNKCSLIKMKTIKHKDGSELYELV